MVNRQNVARRRRLTVAAAITRLTASVVSVFLALLTDADRNPMPWLLALACYFGAWIVAYSLGRPVLEVDRASLDERERLIRDSASWTGLVVLTATTAVLAFALIVGADVDTHLTDVLRERVGNVLLSLPLAALAATSLRAVLALEEGADEDDEEDM